MIQMPPPGANPFVSVTLDSESTDAPVMPETATSSAAAQDPFATFATIDGLHPHLKALIGQAQTGIGAPPAGGMPPAALAFASGIVLLGAPLGGNGANAQQKIGGSNPPLLELGKSTGPIVADLKGHLNIWRERQWRDQRGDPGYPSAQDYLPLTDKFDKRTADALKAFQSAMGMRPTGIADAATQNLLKLEGDQRYARSLNETNKQKVRDLVVSLSTDGAKIDALMKFLDSNAFASVYGDGDKGELIDAIVKSSADPAFLQGLGKLLEDWDFKDLAPDDKTAVLHYLSRHPGAATLGNVQRMLDNPADAGTLIALAQREWQADLALIARREPAISRGVNNAPPNSAPVHLPSATGMITPAEWNDSVALVGRLTQNGAAVNGANFDHRCGAANLLASALLQGPDAAARFLDNVAAKSTSNLKPDERRELKTLADQLRQRSMSFDDLSLVQELLYRAGMHYIPAGQLLLRHPALQTNSPVVPGLSGADATKLQQLIFKNTQMNAADLQTLSRLASTAMGVQVRATVDREHGRVNLNFTQPTGGIAVGVGYDDPQLLALAASGAKSATHVAYDLRSTDAVSKVLERLKPGESAVLPLRGSPASQGANHYVTVGILKDGRPYIYNPDPFNGDATLTVGRSSGPQLPSFEAEVAKYSQRAHNVPMTNPRRATAVAN